MSKEITVEHVEKISSVNNAILLVVHKKASFVVDFNTERGYTLQKCKYTPAIGVVFLINELVDDRESFTSRLYGVLEAPWSFRFLSSFYIVSSVNYKHYYKHFCSNSPHELKIL